MLVAFLAMAPLSLLQWDEPEEFERIGGSYAAVLSWKALPFSIYLALGEFRQNVKSPETIKSFVPAMWAARIQLLSIGAFLICWAAT